MTEIEPGFAIIVPALFMNVPTGGKSCKKQFNLPAETGDWLLLRPFKRYWTRDHEDCCEALRGSRK
jgi:hypothetical protein